MREIVCLGRWMGKVCGAMVGRWSVLGFPLCTGAPSIFFVAVSHVYSSIVFGSSLADRRGVAVSSLSWLVIASFPRFSRAPFLLDFLFKKGMFQNGTSLGLWQENGYPWTCKYGDFKSTVILTEHKTQEASQSMKKTMSQQWGEHCKCMFASIPKKVTCS